MLSRVLQLRKAGLVDRYHKEPWTGPRQKVSEHSFGVVLLLLEMAPPDLLTVELLRYAAHHDLHECVIGDVPATTTWALGLDWGLLECSVKDYLGLGQEFHLSEEQRLLVGLADRLEGMLTTFDQVLAGNPYAHLVMERWIRGLSKKQDLLNCSEWGKGLFHRIKVAYQNVRTDDSVKIRILQDLPELSFWEHYSAVDLQRVPGIGGDDTSSVADQCAEPIDGGVQSDSTVPIESGGTTSAL